MTASDSIGPRRIPSSLPVETHSSKGRRGRSPTRIPKSKDIISDDFIFTGSAPTESSSFYLTPPDHAQSSKIDSSAREIFHPEQESERAASSSSIQSKPPISPTSSHKINDLLFKGELILHTHQSGQATPSSSSSSLVPSYVSQESRAEEMIKRLEEKKLELLIIRESLAVPDENRANLSSTDADDEKSLQNSISEPIDSESVKEQAGIAGQNSDEIKKLDKLIHKIDKLTHKLMEWLEFRRGSKILLIWLLCEKIPPDKLNLFGLDHLKKLFDSLSSSSSLKEIVDVHSEILNKFDSFFHNEATFKKLALHCAISASSDVKSPFRYKKLEGGLGYVVSLNLVETLNDGKEVFHPLFVCKPIEAQPGGPNFRPFSDPITQEKIDGYLEELIKARIEQLNGVARSGLNRINTKHKSLFELTKEAFQLGLLPRDIENLTLEELDVILPRLGCSGQFADIDQKKRFLDCMKALFQSNEIIPGRAVDLVREKIRLNPKESEILRHQLEEENTLQRDRQIIKGGEMTAPFRDAIGIEINHVVISNRSLDKKYHTIFEKPLQSTLIDRFPICLRDHNNKPINTFQDAAMVMEYCPNLGTLESIKKRNELSGENDKQLDEKQFYPEQLETRFILGTIFGFADQNEGNELIVDKQVILTGEGPREMLRLASIDMGQSNPAGPLKDSNPPFYITYEYLRTHEFYKNIFERYQKVDFNQLLNEISILYEGNKLPLSDQQIKLMIYRCESLKKLTQDFLKEFQRGNTISLDSLKHEYHRIIEGEIDGGIDSRVVEIKKSSKSSSKKKRMPNTYTIGTKTYKYRPGS